jgi:hypothetical protein
MLLARYVDLTTVQTNGAIDRLLLQEDNVVLDALAVRSIVVETDTLRGGGPLDLLVGPRECGQRHPRMASFHLPADLRATRLTVLAHLGCSEDVPQGTVAATIRVTAGDRVWIEQPLRAGIDIAEESLVTPERVSRARHGVPASAVERGDDRLSFAQHLALPEPVAGAVVTIEVTGTAGWMELHRLTITDEHGRDVSLGDRELMVASPRWKRVNTFVTGRYTDREGDEDAPEEKSYTVLENRRARPRAWLTREVLPLTRRQIRLALHHSYLPGGRRFDLARTALVDEGSTAAKTFDSDDGVALIRGVEDGAVEAAVSSSGGGMLVLSETAYPGWRALVDGQPAPVHTVNMSLMGVEVPPGDHLVRFEFVSKTLYAGAGLSLAALLTILLLVAPPFTRRGGFA